MSALAAILLAVLLGATAAAPAPASPLRFRVFAHTGLRLTDVVWTGRQFLYVENTTNRIDAAGRVRTIGRYHNPGGADEIAVAPARFGAASGQVLLTVDAGKSGALVAMDAQGRARTLLTLPDGPNPLMVLTPGRTPPVGAARAGLYVADTLSRAVYLAPAAALRRSAGAVLVGSELRGLFWAVRPHGRGFAALPLATTLTGPRHTTTTYNLEGAAYIAG